LLLGSSGGPVSEVLCIESSWHIGAASLYPAMRAAQARVFSGHSRKVRMHVRYEYCVRSEIKLTDEVFPVLSFKRRGVDVRLRKPIARSGLYLSASIVGPAPAMTTGPDLAQDLGASLISVEVESEQCNDQGEIGSILAPVANEVFDDLVPWIRVLTRQYWIGRMDRERSEQRISVSLVGQNRATPLSTSMLGFVFSYGSPLNLVIWTDLGRKMANCEKPPLSRLFFCDALLDILEQHIPQAVVALGVSCELEISGLLQDILARRSEEFRSLFERYARFTFNDEVRMIAEFGGEAFAEVDRESARLVSLLYGMRGQAIHRGECSYDEDGKTVALDVRCIPKFVKAVESFFSWCESQRRKAL